MNACDMETCETCKVPSIEGNDQNGECRGCSGDTSLNHMLRLMAAGVTRNKVSGRFESVKG